jgi:hypothetical protein
MTGTFTPVTGVFPMAPGGHVFRVTKYHDVERTGQQFVLPGRDRRAQDRWSTQSPQIPPPGTRW